MRDEFVSIIVPFYNAETTIERCINSILAQSYTGWKLLLINDGSTDKSTQICERYLSDPRINLYYKENGGVSSARNYAIGRIDTPYFVCIDSDDFVEPEYLQELIKAKERFPEAGHVWCCFQTLYSINQNLMKLNLADRNKKYSIFDRSDVMTLFKLWLLQMPWHKLYNTQIVHGSQIHMDETLSLGEDLLFNLEYLDVCENTKIVVVNLPLYNYVRVDALSLDRKYRSDLIDIFRKTDAKIENFLNQWQVNEEQRQIFYDEKYYHMERLLDNTFHRDNHSSLLDKIRSNNQLIRSKEFQEALINSHCYIHPLVLWSYNRNNYTYIFIINNLYNIKQRIIKLVDLLMNTINMKK